VVFCVACGFAFVFDFGFVLEFIFDLVGVRSSPAFGEGREAFDVAGSRV